MPSGTDDGSAAGHFSNLRFFFQACFAGRITKGVAHALNFHPCPVSEVLPWPFGLRLLRALAGWALFPIHRFSVTSTLDGSLHMNCEKYMTYMQIGESQLAVLFHLSILPEL